MTIEDRVRRVLAEAVADEPALRGAPLEHARRHRRRRLVMAGAVAMALALAVVVVAAAVRSREHPLPSTVPTKGWKTWTDAAGNLRLRYPPDWVVRARSAGLIRIAPPEHAAGATADSPPFAVGVRAAAPGYYLGETLGVNLTRGRLASGQAYVVYDEDPAVLVPPTETPTPSRKPTELPRRRIYTIDWGRGCRPTANHQPSCRPSLVLSGIMAASTPLWDRYRAVAEVIVNTISPLNPTAPSSGDRTRPACRPDQWRLFHPGGWSYGDLAQRYVLGGGVRFVGGPPCHLRLTLRLEVLGSDGRRLPLPGNPSTTTIEGDLPDDRQSARQNTMSMAPSPLNWYWGWQEWCNRDMPRGTMRVTAEGGATISVVGPPSPSTPGEPDTGCRDRGRPSTIAPWP
ncbi:MAG TPA: hypothetical protein VGC06_30435 [Actinomycetes bacterium]